MAYRWRNKKNYSNRRKHIGQRWEPTTNSIHKWRRLRDSNPGNICGRYVLTSISQPSLPRTGPLYLPPPPTHFPHPCSFARFSPIPEILTFYINSEGTVTGVTICTFVSSLVDNFIWARNGELKTRLFVGRDFWSVAWVICSNWMIPDYSEFVPSRVLDNNISRTGHEGRWLSI